MFTNCRNITGAKIQMQEKNKMMSKCLKKLARKFKCKTKIEIKMLAQQLIKCRNKIGAKFQISAYLFIQTFVNKNQWNNKLCEHLHTMQTTKIYQQGIKGPVLKQKKIVLRIALTIFLASSSFIVRIFFLLIYALCNDDAQESKIALAMM